LGGEGHRSQLLARRPGLPEAGRPHGLSSS